MLMTACTGQTVTISIETPADVQQAQAEISSEANLKTEAEAETPAGTLTAAVDSGEGQKVTNKVDFVSLIEKKKHNKELTKEEIEVFAKGAAEGSIPDYQLAAMLMAIRLNGMSSREITDLTLAMRDSGEVLQFSIKDAITVDKHSTGGVGDGTSLVIAPLAAACGVYVPMVSGRGLGHTGGTLDKLESISGFSVNLSEQEFAAMVEETGVSMIGQTDNVAPADKKLYALRDVTSTVDSIPLIAASILSKKLASGTQNLVLDVKTGSGAIMKDLEQSRELARTMVDICSLAGIPAVALVTDMSQPLGTYVGNSLEVEYAIKALKGEVEGDYMDICRKLAGEMLILGKVADDEETAQKMLTKAIESGAALEKFKEMIEAQGGDPAVCDDTSLLPHASVVRKVTVGKDGYIEKMDTTALGNASRLLGAGRLNAEDEVDFGVGYILPVRIGDRVTKDTELCTIYANSEADAKAAEESIRAAITLSDKPVEKPTLIYERITGK